MHLNFIIFFYAVPLLRAKERPRFRSPKRNDGNVPRPRKACDHKTVPPLPQSSGQNTAERVFREQPGPAQVHIMRRLRNHIHKMFF